MSSRILYSRILVPGVLLEGRLGCCDGGEGKSCVFGEIPYLSIYDYYYYYGYTLVMTIHSS